MKRPLFRAAVALSSLLVLAPASVGLAAEVGAGAAKAFPLPPAGPNAQVLGQSPAAAINSLKTALGAQGANSPSEEEIARQLGQSPPAAQPASAGGKKAIYGDIIIHK